MNTNTVETDKKVKVVSECPSCRKIYFIRMPEKAYFNWKQGDLIQNAWPGSTPDEREMLISGLCPSCWVTITVEED